MKSIRLLVGALLLGALAGPAFAQREVPPVAVPAGEILPSPTTTLTAPPGATTTTYPAGTVFSPGCPDGKCCGPIGGNGPVTYELYGRTGPSLVVGGSELSGRLNTGWQVGTGARTLFMNRARDAAWVLETGVSYTYNRGRQERGGPLDVHTPPPNPQTMRDGLQPHLVRGLHRTSFNFGIGRDWWLNGPGFVGAESAWNSRFGLDTGGRWGTAHVDLVPNADLTNYLRKHSVMHSVYIGTHANWERPMGNWILFFGVRGEFDYTFTNVVPPKGGDIVGVHLLMQTGVRY